jgi:hypothetical protein
MLPQNHFLDRFVGTCASLCAKAGYNSMPSLLSSFRLKIHPHYHWLRDKLFSTFVLKFEVPFLSNEPGYLCLFRGVSYRVRHHLERQSSKRSLSHLFLSWSKEIGADHYVSRRKRECADLVTIDWGQDCREETNRPYYMEDLVCLARLALPGIRIRSVFSFGFAILLLVLESPQYFASKIDLA